MQKTPPKPRFWIPFSPTSRSSVGRCRNVVSSALNTVVSTDSRPLRDRQSGHFLETASLHPPLAALRRFPAPLPLIIQNIEGVFLTISGRRGRRPPTEFEGVFRAIGGPMPTSARTKELCTPYILHRQRQRRRRRDDTTFKAPCITLPTVWHAPQRPERYRARKGFQNLGFGSVFCILFAAAGKKYVAEGNPETKAGGFPSRESSCFHVSPSGPPAPPR